MEIRRNFEWSRSEDWLHLCKFLSLHPSGGDGVYHHPVQLHVQQFLHGWHEPAPHPDHPDVGDGTVSIPLPLFFFCDGREENAAVVKRTP